MENNIYYNFYKEIEKRRSKLFTYWNGNKQISQQEFFFLIGGRNCGKTEALRRIAREERRKEREKMLRTEEHREQLIEQKRELYEGYDKEQLMFFVGLLLEQHDFLLERLKHTEGERFNGT